MCSYKMCHNNLAWTEYHYKKEKSTPNFIKIKLQMCHIHYYDLAVFLFVRFTFLNA